MKGLPFFRRLAVQMALAVAAVATVVFGATGWFILEGQRESLTRELLLRILSETRTLSLAAGPALLRLDPELELHPLVKRAATDIGDLVDLVVLDLDGVCQGHADLSRIGSRVEPLPADAGVVIEVAGARALEVDGVLHVERDVDHLDRRIGSLRAVVDRSRIDETVAASIRRLVVTGGTGTALGLLLVLVLVTHRLRPLEGLRTGVQRIGGGDLTTRVELRDRSEFGLLADHVNRMAEGLAYAQDERIRQERIDRELEIAHNIQSTLLPRRLPEVEGIDIAADYEPALEVSGDYYDVFALDDGRIAFVVADVSGKGVPGLVIMAMVRLLLRELASTGATPGQVLRRANARLVAAIPRQMFVTMVVGVLRPETGEIVYASGGHCPPVLYGAVPARELPAGGKPVGMFPAAIFDPSVKEHCHDLQSGQAFLLYTDGLAECTGSDGVQLGEAAILETLDGCDEHDARADLESLLERVEIHRRDHPPSDDLTLLALRRSAPVPTKVVAT